MNDCITLTAGGDVNLKAPANDSPLTNVKNIFIESDISFLNLETCITSSSAESSLEKVVSIRTSPENLNELKGIPNLVVNIGHNHIEDFGPKGVLDTIKNLKKYNINFIGVHDSVDINNKPMIIKSGGIKIGFIGYSNKKQIYEKYQINHLNLKKLNNIKDSIQKLRKKVDIMVVSVHWGVENVRYPSPRQQYAARKFIDWGGHIVLGHHPHVFQGYEEYNKGLIFYSLGNLNFRMKEFRDERVNSYIAKIKILPEKNLTFDIIPIKINNNGQPHLFDDSIEKERRLELLEKISSELIPTIPDAFFYKKVGKINFKDNFKSYRIRIQRYGTAHFFMMLRWFISPFTIKCIYGIFLEKTDIYLKKLRFSNTKDNKIGIIGPYPPPYGGKSVFVQRLGKFLNNKKIDCKLYVYSSRAMVSTANLKIMKDRKIWCLKYFFFSKEQVILSNKVSDVFSILCIILKLVRRKKIIVYHHGEHIYSIAYTHLPFFRKALKVILTKMLLKFADIILIVNEAMKKQIADLKIDTEKIHIIPAFIPPILDKKEIPRMPDEVHNFIKQKKIVIVANGWIRFFKEQDLYGIDLLIEMMKLINEPDIGLVIYLIGVDSIGASEKKYYSKLQDHVSENNLGCKIVMHESIEEEFWPVLTKSHIFIRPTTSDGDSVSVREALYFGAKTICSDVTHRPEGVVLFKNRDVNDLMMKVKDAINEIKISGIKKPSNSDSFFSGAAKIENILKNLL